MAVESATQRVAPGGTATISLGSDSMAAALSERDQAKKAAFETPAATARFPQAPGGNASVCLGGDVTPKEKSSRGPVGGAAAVVLGNESAAEFFAERQREREAPVCTPDALERFPQAPGGNTTLKFDDSAEATSQSATRGPVGGASTVCLGTDSSADRFAAAEASFETPDALERFPQPPGGNVSVQLSGGQPAAVALRGPVGGAATLVLSDDAPAAEAHVPRGPIGGADSVLLGTHDARETFDARRRDAEACLSSPTPDATERFPQAPGGTSTLRLGSDGQDVAAHVVRGPVGGADTLVLSDEVVAQERRPATASRPIGGADTVMLGDEACSKAVFEERRAEREAVMPTPDATVRFPQAPGGTDSVCLGGGEAPLASPPRGPVGGAATLVLGGEDSRETFEQRRLEREAAIETPDALARFPQAPGGTSTVTLNSDFVAEPMAATRGPSGGASTVVLGSDDSKAMFEEFRKQRSGSFETPDATQRFPQAPGGNSSVVLGGAAPTPSAPSRGPVGGQATVVLGDEATTGEACRQRQEKNAHAIATPEPAPRFAQVPGGNSTVDFSNSSPAEEACVRGPVGGVDDVVLGCDDSKQDFAERAAIRSSPVATPEAAPRFQQAPGGTASVILGGAPPLPTPVASPNRQPPGGNSTFGQAIGGDYPHEIAARSSANAFANGSSQNSGNVMTDRPTTRVQQTPGGNSTLVLGDEKPRGSQAAVSSNAFASGASQNSGNVLTERSTTRLHQAPGGNSSLVLGGGYPHDIAEARANEGGMAPTISDGARRRLLQSPGGNSTLSLGEEEKPKAATTRPCTRSLQAPGGTSTICLGTDTAPVKVVDENVDTMNTAPVLNEKEAAKEASPDASPIVAAPMVVG